MRRIRPSRALRVHVRTLLCLTLWVALTWHVHAAPIVWAVGAEGTVVTSSDMGLTWTPQVSGTSKDLRGVDFLSPLYGIAVGASGTLLRTTNGGSTWAPIASGVTTTLHDVVLSGPDTGAAVGEGERLIRTLNGGESWITFTFVTSQSFRALASASGPTLLAVGEDRVWARSTDGGIPWSSAGTNVAQTSNPPLHWVGVTGTGGTSAVAVGADQNGGMVTRYNGSAWSPAVYIGSFAPTPTPLGFELFDVAFTGNTVVAVGAGGVVSRSSNGGFDWTAPTSVASFDLLDVEFFDALNGLAVGGDGNVIRTSDGGLTWSGPIDAASRTLFAVTFVEANIRSVAEPPTVLLTAMALLMLAMTRRYAGLGRTHTSGI